MVAGLLKSTSALALLLALSTASFANNVVTYKYDAAGNIVEIKRVSAGSFAITGFDPASGEAGAAVTIYGTGFSATPANNVVKFNGVTASVSASATGSISTAVPAGATTGRITVTVGANTATSAQDFIVVVPGAPTISGFTPGSGDSGSTVTVTGTNFNATPGATVVKLNGTTASSSVSSATSLSFTVPGAVATGKITATTSAGTGTSSQDFLVPPPGVAAGDILATRRLSVGGSTENLAVYSENKHGLLLVDGAADAFLSLQFSLFESSPTTASVAYKIYKPDNTLLAQGTVGFTTRTTIHLPKLPVAGTYSVLISPGLATLNTLVRLEGDPALAIDGAPAASALFYQNQSKRFIVDATAGQRIGLGITGLSHSPTNANRTTFKVYKPDGSQLMDNPLPYCTEAAAGNPQGNCDGEFLAPAAGAYEVIAESPQNSYSSFTAQANSEVTGTLVADVQQSVALSRVGQDARYSFTAAVGDSFGIDASGAAPLPQAQSIAANVYRPDGTSLTACSGIPPAGVFCELGTLGTAGTYSVAIDPAYGAYGTFKLTLKQGALIGPADAASSFAPLAAAEAVRLRFSGTAGQSMSVGVSGLANTPASSSVSTLYVYRPDRSTHGNSVNCSPNAAGGSCKLTLASLPSTGTYSVALVPAAGNRISGSLNVSSDVTSALTAGTAQTVTATRAGQNARLTFPGTAGDSTSLKVFGVTTTPASQTVNVMVYRPDGGLLASNAASSAAPILVNLGSLPSTGTYSVLLEPVLGVTWQAQVMLDPGTLVAVDGAMPSFGSAAAGEPLRYRFAGTAGQRIEIGMAGLGYTPAGTGSSTMTLYRPDGIQLGSVSCAPTGSGSCEMFSTSLPSTGTYALVMAPPSGNALSAGSLAVSTPATGTLTIGAATQTVDVSRPGQTARYAFSGTASQLLRLNWTGTTVSGGASVAVTVLKPDGSTLSSSSFATGATGGFDIASLPTTGTYTVVFDPASAATLSAPVTLVTR